MKIKEKLTKFNLEKAHSYTTLKMLYFSEPIFIKIEHLSDDVRKLLTKVIEENPILYNQNPSEVLEAISYESDVPQFTYFLPIGEDEYFGAGLIYLDCDTNELEIDSMWCSGRLDVNGVLKQIAFN